MYLPLGPSNKRFDLPVPYNDMSLESSLHVVAAMLGIFLVVRSNLCVTNKVLCA